MLNPNLVRQKYLYKRSWFLKCKEFCYIKSISPSQSYVNPNPLSNQKLKYMMYKESQMKIYCLSILYLVMWGLIFKDDVFIYTLVAPYTCRSVGFLKVTSFLVTATSWWGGGLVGCSPAHCCQAKLHCCTMHHPPAPCLEKKTITNNNNNNKR